MPELIAAIKHPACKLLALLAVCAAGLLISSCELGRSAELEVELISVSVEPLNLQPSYTATQLYAGRVQSVRASQVGFDLGGELRAVHVHEGAQVNAGELLAELDSSRIRARLKRSQADLAQAQAEQEIARLTHQRYQAVRGSEAVSEQVLDQSRQSLAAATAAVAAAQANVGSLKLDIQKTRLEAPYAARVVSRLHDEGEIVAAGQAVLSLQESAALEARVGVSKRTAAQLKLGDSYQLEINDHNIPVTLKSIVSSRDLSTRTLDARFALSDTDAAQLVSGDLVRLKTQRTVSQSGYWVPVTALREANRGLWSLLIAESGDESNEYRLSPRAVTVLHSTGDKAFVQGALQQGERYVNQGLHRVVAGQAVHLTALESS